MIINGGSRSNGRFFASHLMRADHNERVEVRDIRGLLAENVPDAFREMSAVASGTMCKNYFYHADINTREGERLSPEQWAAAADALERELELDNQPRLIVEHEKNGRTHQHIIWSRIDGDNLTAVSDSHNYRRHELVARALEKAFDHEPTRGPLSREFGTERPERGPSDREAFRAQESKIDPKAMKAEVTELWNKSDSGRAFTAALADQGYLLARGDRRDFCLIDRAGDEHSLGRRIAGFTAAEIRIRMADIDAAALPSVAEGRALARDLRDQADETDVPVASADIPAIDRSPFGTILDETMREAAGSDSRFTLGEAAAGHIDPTAERSAFDRIVAAALRDVAAYAARFRELEATGEGLEPAPYSPFEAIFAETIEEAKADQARAAEEERSGEGRFERWQAWWKTLLDHVADWRELVVDFFRRDERETPETERER